MSARAQIARPGASGYFSAIVPGRKGEILDAALEVFAEKGYEGGTLRQIAERVGVTEPALYRHYRGKEALFADVIATAGGRLVAEAHRMLSEVEPVSLRSSLTTLLETRRSQGAHARPVLHTLLMAAPHNPALRESLRAHVAAPMADNVRGLIPRVDAFIGLRRTPEETESAVRVFMSLLIGYLLSSEMLGLPADDGAVVDALLVSMGWEGVA